MGYKNLYVKYSTSGAGLPLFVADSPRELADMCGIKADTVYRCISLGICGYKKVQVPWTIEDERIFGDLNE